MAEAYPAGRRVGASLYPVALICDWRVTIIVGLKLTPSEQNILL